jgi:hypothetical protein
MSLVSCKSALTIPYETHETAIDMGSYAVDRPPGEGWNAVVTGKEQRIDFSMSEPMYLSLNTIHRIFFIIILVIFVATGCATSAVLDEMDDDFVIYTEEVSSILVSEDGKQLVFIGNNYHYIFDVPEQLLLTLKSSFRKSISAHFGKFRIGKNNNIKGKVGIVLNEPLSGMQRYEAISIGYESKKDNGSRKVNSIQYSDPNLYNRLGDHLANVFSLKGKRSKSRGITEGKNKYKLNRSYKVTVLDKPGMLKKIVLGSYIPIAIGMDVMVGFLFGMARMP